MNKTFKVIFNRARATLMVANEITRSVQKKGTKTVLASAVALALSSTAVAAEVGKAWNNSIGDGTTQGNVSVNYSNSNDSAYGVLVQSGAAGEFKGIKANDKNSLSIEVKDVTSSGGSSNGTVYGIISQKTISNTDTPPPFRRG